MKNDICLAEESGILNWTFRKRHQFMTEACLLAASFFWVGSVNASGIFISSSSNASVVFADGLGGTTMGITYADGKYWSVSGGSTGGQREASYASSGGLLASYSPGHDFRSIFSDLAGNVYARDYASPTVYKQTSPGVFTSQLTLTGGPLDSQAAVVLNGTGTEFIAQNSGTISRWNLAGSFLGSVTLLGYGTSGFESSYPNSNRVASAGDYWLTYDGGGTLSAWNASGTRVGTTILNSAGTNFDSNFSFSFANGKAFVVSGAGGTWNGYDVGLATVPEPTTMILSLGAFTLLGIRRRAVST